MPWFLVNEEGDGDLTMTLCCQAAFGSPIGDLLFLCLRQGYACRPQANLCYFVGALECFPTE